MSLNNILFSQVLRRHVMVRTGGGWDTLESFLGRHDPCRCNSKGESFYPSKSFEKLSFIQSIYSINACSKREILFAV